MIYATKVTDWIYVKLYICKFITCLQKMLDYECANTKLKYDVTQLRLQVKSLEEKLSSHHCQYHPAAPKNSPEVTQLFTDVTQLGTSDVTQMASSHVTLSTGQHVLPPAGMMVNSMSLLLPDQNYSWIISEFLHLSDTGQRTKDGSIMSQRFERWFIIETKLDKFMPVAVELVIHWCDWTYFH